MSRCGCSSAGASGAAITRSSCMSASGAGTPSSPFSIAPVIDPSASNLLACGASGLLAINPDSPGAWSVFYPGWYADGGYNPVIGDGILIGIYRKRGHSLSVMIELVFGTTTSGGAGTWSWDLPAGLISGFTTPVPFFSFDSTPGYYQPGSAIAAVGEGRIRGAVNGAGGVLGSGLAYGFGSTVYLGGTVYVTT